MNANDENKTPASTVIMKEISNDDVTVTTSDTLRNKRATTSAKDLVDVMRSPAPLDGPA
jgi:hypothetical protein